MWQVVYNKLKDKGLNPFPPGKHTGECLERYCVVRDGSQSPSVTGNRTGYGLIDIILFVPIASYIQVKPYVQAVRAAMQELPNLRKTGSETPVITDDEVKAYTTSIEYQVLKKLEG